MRRSILAGLAVGVLSISGVAHAQMGQTGQQPQTGQQAQMGQQGQMGGMMLSGVVTDVDAKSNTITFVAPVESTETVARQGDTLIVDRDRNLIAIRAQVPKGSHIMRDGKQAKLNAIKEGDIVRTSFNEQNLTVQQVNAHSPEEIKKSLKEGHRELMKEGERMQRQMDSGQQR